MATQTTIQNLLQQVSAINMDAEKNGENFNIFRILKIEKDEVRTHSAFLAELLNPQGSHGQKDYFLKYFLTQLRKKHKFNTISFDTEGAIVEVEKGIGTKTETTGGRIDIVLSNKKNNPIIIENKIYADDQENQLIRYHNYYKNAHLVYLTLDGHKPDEWSTRSKEQELDQEKIILLSYEKDIIEWLSQCLKETAIPPILTETITQYINLIKFLNSKTMNNKIKEELSKKENLSAAITITNTMKELEKESLEYFWNNLGEKLNGFIKKEDEYEVFYEFSYKFRNTHNLYLSVQQWKDKVILGFWAGKEKEHEDIQENHDFHIVCPLFLNNSSKNNRWWIEYTMLEENAAQAFYIDEDFRERIKNKIIKEVNAIISELKNKKNIE